MPTASVCDVDGTIDWFQEPSADVIYDPQLLGSWTGGILTDQGYLHLGGYARLHDQSIGEVGSCLLYLSSLYRLGQDPNGPSAKQHLLRVDE